MWRSDRACGANVSVEPPARGGRMMRWLRRAVVLVSAALSVGCAVLLARSYKTADVLAFARCGGTARDGWSQEWFVRSNLAELVFAFAPATYHEATEDNPNYPNRYPPRWYSHEADTGFLVRNTVVRRPYGYNLGGFAV